MDRLNDRNSQRKLFYKKALFEIIWTLLLVRLNDELMKASQILGLQICIFSVYIFYTVVFVYDVCFI